MLASSTARLACTLPRPASRSASPIGTSATGLASFPNRPVSARTAQLLAEQRRRQIQRRCAGQHALAQRNVLHVSDIPPGRHLRIGAAIDIFEQEMRQTTAANSR